MRTADALHDARAQLLSIHDASDKLLEVYMDLYTALNQLYADYPSVYAELQRTVRLPTNDDADDVTALNHDLHNVLVMLADDAFLKTVLNGDDLQTQVGEPEGEQ